MYKPGQLITKYNKIYRIESAKNGCKCATCSLMSERFLRDNGIIKFAGTVEECRTCFFCVTKLGRFMRLKALSVSGESERK